MKAAWHKLAARIDTLSLRERAFLFLSIIAVCMALANVLLLEPAQAQHKQLTQRFERQTAELQRARDELKTLSKPVDRTQHLRESIEAVKVGLTTVNQHIGEILPTRGDAGQLAQLLTQLLRRHEGLTLVRAASLAPQAAGAAGQPVVLTRQGVELTVSGPYLELMRYVDTLEKMLPKVRWGVMQLKSEKVPAELHLQLILVGLAS